MTNSQKRSPLATVAKGAVAVAAGTLLALSNTPGASAHGYHWISVGSNPVAGEARFEGTTLTYCDRDVDGNRVRVQMLDTWSNLWFSGWAPSGGCYTEGHPTSIKQFRVCAENIGCSSWHNRL